jgi:nucleoside-diphosphate-sugar epimerase
MTRVLVTGGSGYFGEVLVRRLLEDGRSTRIFDLVDSTLRPESVELIVGDIRDGAAVRRACAGVETVYHSVAQVPLAKNRSAFWSVNHEGTRVLLEACLESGVRKVVHLSSSAVYGIPRSNPVDERTEPRPGEEYGRAKLAAEEACREAVGRGLDVTIVRPRTILGHGRLGIMQILFEWIREGKPVPVLDRGTNVYQFVHAGDLAEGCLLAAARP